MSAKRHPSPSVSAAKNTTTPTKKVKVDHTTTCTSSPLTGQWHPQVDALIHQLKATDSPATVAEVVEKVNALPKDINPIVRTKNSINLRWNRILKHNIIECDMTDAEYEILRAAVKDVQDDGWRYVAEANARIAAEKVKKGENINMKTIGKATARKLWNNGEGLKEKVSSKE